MPIYEFRCNDTGNRFEVEFDSIKAYSDATITSPFNGSTNVTRVINRVNFTRIDNASNTIIEDTRNITKLGHQDPKALAYSLRKAVDESGGTGDDKFETVMRGLESGKATSDIEKSLPKDSLTKKPKSSSSDVNSV